MAKKSEAATEAVVAIKVVRDGDAAEARIVVAVVEVKSTANLNRKYIRIFWAFLLEHTSCYILLLQKESSNSERKVLENATVFQKKKKKLAAFVFFSIYI